MDPARLKCEIHTPDSSTPASHSVSRWSDTGILGHPALVVVPETEDDIRDALKYATAKGLQVFPAGGGHGSFVPITSRTLYLDMKRFNKVDVDSKDATVSVGGGAVTRQMIQACTDHGFYTTWANSNAVGIVGSILGGGSSTTAGLHGMMIDNVLSIRLITSQGRTVEVSASSVGEDLALFHALCGAGNGLGVVTSLTMKIHPISKLQLSSHGVWSRRLIFPESKIGLAATVFDRLRPPPACLSVTMVSARAPSNAPKPDAPMVILTATYYGPPEQAERATLVLFEEHVVSEVISAQTEFKPMANINDAYAALDAHGGFKDTQSVWLKTTTPQAIEDAFKRWLEYTTKNEDAKPTIVILSSFNTQKQLEIKASAGGQARYFDHRDRGMQALVITSFTNEATTSIATDFASEIKALYRAHDAADVPRTLLNNIGPDTKLCELRRRGSEAFSYASNKFRIAKTAYHSNLYGRASPTTTTTTTTTTTILLLLFLLLPHMDIHEAILAI